MNCFEWQSNASDFLDGALDGVLKRQAESHVLECKECDERYKHYRILLTSIAGRRSAQIPLTLRKAPLSALLPRPMSRAGTARARWERVPWYIRTTLEGSAIVLLILAGISAGPKLRLLYERNIERSVSELNDTFNDPVSLAALIGERPAGSDIPLARGKSDMGSPAAEGDEYSGENEAEQDEEDDAAGGDAGDSEIHVGNSEIWRFNLKTDSPHEIRPKIVQILTDLRIAPTTPGLGGIEAPGGIQFDLMVSKNAIPGLKRQLQKLAPKAPEGLSNSAMGETFAWYKNKSRKKLPDGKTRIVIWLSQM